MRTSLLTLACSTLLGSALQAQTIEAPFSADYTLTDLGQPSGIPGNLGGITLRRAEPDTLFVVGLATRADAAVYRMRIIRDGVGHIMGFDGDATFHAASPNADGGLQFAECSSSRATTSGAEAADREDVVPADRSRAIDADQEVAGVAQEGDRASRTAQPDHMRERRTFDRRR